MRKLAISALSAAALVMTVTPAAMAAPPAGSATGDVSFNSGAESISFNAFDYGETGDRGTATYTNNVRQFSYTAEITAVSVDPGTGTACFQYVIPAGAPNAGLALTYKVVDSGTPSDTPDAVDYVRTDSERTLEANCARVQPRETTSGNLVVHSVR